jgi:hypothetical protein
LIGALRRYLHRCLKHFGFAPVPRLSARFPIFFKVASRARNSNRAGIGKDFSNFGGVFVKNRRDQGLAFWGERYDPDTPILKTLDPAYQASIQQAVDGHADRAGRKVPLWAYRIHWQRPFVEECFKYPEVGIVDSRLLESRIKIFRSRSEGFPQWQPTVNRVSRVLGHDETIVPSCITDVQ